MRQTFKVSQNVWLVRYYDRATRLWWAYYQDSRENQLGDAWADASREYVLIHRPDAPKVLAMDYYRAIGLIEGFVECSTGDEESEMLEAWQHLIDTGVAWKLQGRIGRTAMDMIENGLCTPPSPTGD